MRKFIKFFDFFIALFLLITGIFITRFCDDITIFEDENSIKRFFGLILIILSGIIIKFVNINEKEDEKD